MKSLRTPAARAVAEILKETREASGLTQRDLATRVGRVRSVIGMIESQQRQVNVPELITLSDAMGADPVDVFKRIVRATKAR